MREGLQVVPLPHFFEIPMTMEKEPPGLIEQALDFGLAQLHDPLGDLVDPRATEGIERAHESGDEGTSDHSVGVRMDEHV
jgi:hypothetical protein